MSAQMPSTVAPSTLLQEQHEEVALGSSIHGQFDFSLCRRNDALLGILLWCMFGCELKLCPGKSDEVYLPLLCQRATDG